MTPAAFSQLSSRSTISVDDKKSESQGWPLTLSALLRHNAFTPNTAAALVPLPRWCRWRCRAGAATAAALVLNDVAMVASARGGDHCVRILIK